MSHITITVDDQPLQVEAGDLLIRVLNHHHIAVPHFCYHEALGADGNCRMCMVEIEGQKRPQIACDTFVKEGMVVRTKGKNIDAVRRNILELELINHPVDCPICDQAGECKLQDYYMDYGLYDSHIAQSDKVHHRKHVDLGSNVMLDQERCVLCARCTRFVSDVTQTHELGIIGRGDHARVSTMPGKQLNNPYAMNVVDLCPVGALTSKDFRFKQRVWFLTSTPSICQGCDTGCNIYIDHNQEKYKDDTIYRFRPRENSDINGFFICDAGRMSYKALQENRQVEALLAGEALPMERSIASAQNLLLDAGESVVILADANLYNEALDAIMQLAQKLNATYAAPLACYEDPTFGDDWLKSSQRAANKAGVIARGFTTTLPDSADLVINFNHPQGAQIDATKRIDIVTHQGSTADIVLPLASFSEASGTLTNKTGINQYAQQAIHRTDPLPTVQEWIDLLVGGDV
jgi:NADH-quinone oxidoreductase subunit G